MTKRTAVVERNTTETQIALKLDLDGSGKYDVRTGVGFFDHMLSLLARHALFDLTVKVTGDTHVDAHHTVEDTGICLGQALARALGDKKGIVRHGSFLLPMDESLARIVLDISGRAFLAWRAEIPGDKCGDFDTCLGQEFMRGFVTAAGIAMHVDLLASGDPHHGLEAIFKGVGRSLRMAVAFEKTLP
jgi:imidazoleglycerol-phosphate dehydratase